MSSNLTLNQNHRVDGAGGPRAPTENRSRESIERIKAFDSIHQAIAQNVVSLPSIRREIDDLARMQVKHGRGAAP
jgi:hypothetical protein